MINVKHMLRGFIVSVIFLYSIPAVSQGLYRKTMISLDLAGTAGIFALKTEYAFLPIGNSHLTFNAGLGYLPIRKTNFLALPVGFNLVAGKRKHHVDLGVGGAYLKGNEFLSFAIFPDFIYPRKALFFTPIVGYRFDKPGGGFVFRAYYSPLILLKDYGTREYFVKEGIKQGYPEFLLMSESFFQDFNRNRSLNSTTTFINFGLSFGYRFK